MQFVHACDNLTHSIVAVFCYCDGMHRLVRHGADGAHALGSCGNALIVIWRAQPDGVTLRHVGGAAERLLDRFPRGIGVLGVSRQMPLSDADDRGRLAPLLQVVGDRMLGLASVLEGDGHTVSVMACINQVKRHPCPLKVFGTVDEGVAWLAPLLGRPPAIALRHAVAALRRD
jgi:hypothetical protein